LVPAALLRSGQGEASADSAGRIGAACVDCHADIVASYREGGMARALGPLDADEAQRLAALSAIEESASGFRYHFGVTQGEARVVESWIGSAGEPFQTGSAPVRFAIGAGLFDRSYALARGGMIWFGPLEVMSGADGPHAVLAPAHEQAPGVRFRHPVTGECLGCHTDRLPLQEYPANADPRDFTPVGITCAACHGDVDAHVAWREEDLSGGAPTGADPVVTSRKLERAERLSVCARCHLQGDARIGLVRGERGVPPAGDDFLEHYGVWTAAEETDDIGFVSQVERLVRSACFTESGSPSWGSRALSCETCHDPHGSVFEERERAQVRAACTACHGPAHEPRAPDCSRMPVSASEDDCVTCHMRRTPVFDLSHVEIHDHFIRKEPPPPSAFTRIRAKQSTGPALERFSWPGLEPPPLAGDPGLEMMALIAASKKSVALELVDERPDRSVFRLPNYHHVRGTLLQEVGRHEDARKAYERVLILDPGRPETLVNLGLTLAHLGRAAEAIERLNAVIERYPEAEGALRNRAVARAAAGDTNGALADLEAAQRVLPRPENARALADLCERVGEAARAADWRAEATRLEPGR
jgi:predicted CXXCH cytochrome family protein